MSAVRYELHVCSAERQRIVRTRRRVDRATALRETHGLRASCTQPRSGVSLHPLYLRERRQITISIRSLG